MILTFGLLSNSVRAQTVLTWQDCVRESKEHQPDLRSVRQQIEQARAAKRITQGTILPQINSTLTQKTSKIEKSVPTESYSYGATGKQLLFDGFKSFYDIAQKKEDLTAEEFNYAVVCANVRLNLRKAFVKLLKTQELLKIIEDITHRRKQNFDLVQLRYEAGREHKGALLTAQANLAQAQFEMTQAGRSFELSQRELIKEMGQDIEGPLIVEGTLALLNGDRQKPDFVELIKRHPLLKQSAAQSQAAFWSLKSAKADFFPQIYANASVNQSDPRWPPEKNDWSTGVSLTFPIFDGWQRNATVTGSMASFQKAKADEESHYNETLLSLEQAWIDFQNAVDNVTLQQKFLEANQERARIAEAQYSNGLISFDDWTIIEDNLANSRKAFLESQAQALIAEAAWVQAKGGTLEDEDEQTLD